jgi:hypothetical protein
VCSNQAESDGFLTAIKTRSTTSFGGEVKTLIPCHKILLHVKEPYIYKQTLIAKIQGYFSPIFSLLRYQVSLLQPEKKNLVDRSGIIRIQIWIPTYHKTVAVAWDALYDATPLKYTVTSRVGL